MSQPKVSCLCVSRGGSDLIQAIKDFQAQTWENKELVVVTSGEVKTLGFVGIDLKWVEPPGGMDSVGARRNLAVQRATGDLVCTWDDDDRHHPERIAMQMQFNGLLGCTLRQIHIADRNGDYHLSESRPTGWEGTLLCRRRVLLDHPYADLSRQEDAHIGSLVRKYKMAKIITPDLYVYRLHNTNVSGDAHRLHLLRHATRLVPWQVAELKQTWESKL